jgi:hypothetical protein
MEIKNFRKLPEDNPNFALFDVYIPALELTLRNFRLRRGKKGGWYINSANFKDGNEWVPYIAFSSEKFKDFSQKCHELLKEHMK